MNNLGPEADAGITWTKNSGLPLLARGREQPVQAAGALANRQAGAFLNYLLLGLSTEPVREQPPRPAKQVWDAACTRGKYMSTGCGQDVVRTVKET